jgi:hypothetical protein
MDARPLTAVIFRAKRLPIMAACCIVLSCSDSVDQAARSAYELTLRSPNDGSGYSIRPVAPGRVPTWQIRLEGSWDEYARWVRPRLTREFGAVVPTPGSGLLFKKSLDADVYMLELRASDPAQGGYVKATFTARPF